MRLCFICPEYPPSVSGGLGVVTQVLARELVRRGHVVRVVGSYPPGDATPEYEVQDRVEVWRLDVGRGRVSWMRSRAKLFQMVRRWAQQGEIDLVEAPQSRGWCAGWSRLPIPVVIRFHGSVCLGETRHGESGRGPGRLRFMLEWLALRRADRFCAVSRSIAALTRERFRLGDAEIPILYNPVDLPDTPAGASAPIRQGNRVLFAGTCSAYKGIPVLLTAWRLIRLEFPRAELHVYGREGEPGVFDSIRQVSREVGGVILHGYENRAQVLTAFRTASVAVFPSRGEAFGLAAAEAMGCGCATVLSAAGSGPELVRDGVDGILVDPGSAEQVARAVCRLLGDPVLSEGLGQNGSRRVGERFSIERAVAESLAFYAATRAAFTAKRGSGL